MSEQMPPSNTGHGHVWPRPDGIKARCGGPAICRECARDAARNAAPAAPPAPTDYTGLILRLKREGSVTVSDRFDAADALTALLRERDALWACVEAADALGNADRVKCRECGMYQIHDADFSGYDRARAALAPAEPTRGEGR